MAHCRFDHRLFCQGMGADTGGGGGRRGGRLLTKYLLFSKGKYLVTLRLYRCATKNTDEPIIYRRKPMRHEENGTR